MSRDIKHLLGARERIITLLPPLKMTEKRRNRRKNLYYPNLLNYNVRLLLQSTFCLPRLPVLVFDRETARRRLRTRTKRCRYFAVVSRFSRSAF